MRSAAAVGLLLLLLAGCPSSQPQGAFKVALVTPGPTTDLGWNALAWDGAQAIDPELKVKVAYSQQSDSSKFESELRAFALDGAKLIFAHGLEFQPHAEVVGAKFPDTIF